MFRRRPDEGKRCPADAKTASKACTRDGSSCSRFKRQMVHTSYAVVWGKIGQGLAGVPGWANESDVLPIT